MITMLNCYVKDLNIKDSHTTYVFIKEKEKKTFLSSSFSHQPPPSIHIPSLSSINELRCCESKEKKVEEEKTDKQIFNIHQHVE